MARPRFTDWTEEARTHMTLRDLSPGERVYVKKGWRNVEARNAVIRKRHREHTTRKRSPLRVGVSIARLAYDFRLSESRIWQIVSS
jgi:hypothetical protein